MLERIAIGVLAALAATTAVATAAPQPPFATAGGYITDSTGRVFVSHGVNMVYKVAPYEPAAAGFDDEDAAFLAREGADEVFMGEHELAAGMTRYVVETLG
jgi:endoglycosylceramidase